MMAAERADTPLHLTPQMLEGELRQKGETAERVIYPIALMDERKLLPKGYIVHHRSQTCRNCGTLHEWADTYALHEIPPLHNAGKWVRNLTPCSEFRYNLPIHHVLIERRLVPACHECFSTADLTHLPKPQDSEEWKALVARKRAAEQAAAAARIAKDLAKGVTPRKAKPTIDDIL